FPSAPTPASLWPKTTPSPRLSHSRLACHHCSYARNPEPSLSVPYPQTPAPSNVNAGFPTEIPEAQLEMLATSVRHKHLLHQYKTSRDVPVAKSQYRQRLLVRRGRPIN